ncbi:hypothetical protein DJ568_16150 [Mucilaginibacter hurinus]|uniref:Outer membrane protein beta-barrel domain-containing protein n=1 Tax=Mucilaginibacter hurinus TaxID=2201324 RepID=A0A367GJX7_9SPHI|nr:hypothetical protein [Mucilaginibacter hurinus]RCH53769.1 hypothetical protein DJ568_16150 [Mucilaginibacter hurinus]
MIGRLYFNSGYHTKCITAVVSICLFTLTANAQSRGFSASVSGGFSKAKSSNGGSLFTEADKGYYVQASGMFPLGKRWGGVVNIQHNVLSANSKGMAERLLHTDPNAVALTVETGAFNITNAGAGIYYDWNFGNSFFVRLSPLIGYSQLQTPEITVIADTEPHTTYTYKAGGSGAFYYALHVRPSLMINKRFAVLIDAGYQYAGYKLSGIMGKQVLDDKVNYGTFNAGLGFQYRFGSK